MHKTLIIAEAGVNHNGDIDIASELIDAATDAGANIIKFQTFTTKNILLKTSKKAEYQKVATDIYESQYEMLRKLELSKHDHQILADYCVQKGIEFLSSPFDLESIDLLNELGVKRFKIPSGEITNLPYLRYISSMGKPIILSTGMSTLEEVDGAINIILESGLYKDEITLLHCNTEYPTPMKDVNLKAMLTMRDKFGVNIGYSDHTLGIEIPIAAVALGATVIEKHFTLDRNLPGPDHSASLECDELKSMVVAIRNIEIAIGNGIKRPSPSEIENIAVARKSIVANKSIMKGEQFNEDNLAVKRPGTGLSPMMWDSVVGRESDKDYNEDDFIL